MCPCVHAVSCFIYPFLPAGSPFFWLFQTPDSQVVLSPCLVKIFPGPKIKAFLFLFLYGQARTTVTKLRLVKTSFGPHLYIGPTENSHLFFFLVCVPMQLCWCQACRNNIWHQHKTFIPTALALQKDRICSGNVRVISHPLNAHSCKPELCF